MTKRDLITIFVVFWSEKWFEKVFKNFQSAAITPKAICWVLFGTFYLLRTVNMIQMTLNFQCTPTWIQNSVSDLIFYLAIMSKIWEKGVFCLSLPLLILQFLKTWFTWSHRICFFLPSACYLKNTENRTHFSVVARLPEEYNI